VGEEAGLGGRVNSEGGIEKRGDDDGRDEDNANLVRCAVPFRQQNSVNGEGGVEL
jgi:hypothetical protein